MSKNVQSSGCRDVARERHSSVDEQNVRRNHRHSRLNSLERGSRPEQTRFGISERFSNDGMRATLTEVARRGETGKDLASTQWRRDHVIKRGSVQIESRDVWSDVCRKLEKVPLSAPRERNGQIRNERKSLGIIFEKSKY